MSIPIDQFLSAIQDSLTGGLQTIVMKVYIDPTTNVILGTELSNANDMHALRDMLTTTQPKQEQ